MIIFAFGWAKPVMINPLNFREAKKRIDAGILAGPRAILLLPLLQLFCFI